MHHRLGVEDIEPDHWVAWVLDLPGCFSSGVTQEDAVSLLPASVAAYREWLVHHGLRAADEPIDIDSESIEVFRAFKSEGDHLVNAFFAGDRRALAMNDVARGLALLDCSRRDLLALPAPLSPSLHLRPIDGELHGSLAGILSHVAGAEQWYLSHWGRAVPRTDLPAEPLAQLEVVRRRTRRTLARLVGDEAVVTHRGERWSARKLLRRALWHERDHTQHIARLLAD